jgi:hypothetical protein
MISLAFLTTWGQSGASGCRSINHCELGARKPCGARLFGVFALVQIGFKFPFGQRRIGEFGRKARDAPGRCAGALPPEQVGKPTDAWRRNFSGRGGAAGQPDRGRFAGRRRPSAGPGPLCSAEPASSTAW